jgi:excisionase family DNA binding protein
MTDQDHARTAGERLTFTVDEAAAILGIGRNTAYEAIRRREIPSVRFGRRLLVPRNALENLLAAATRQPARADN